ncbi:type II secretion system minor pseudopilin GspK [Pseudoduganella sp. UC29_106]|uniref:type II secretion system minor pseudopilin GspK n=1 Tax=Pseudoduganella sp. UC29_106 TaxID=3374553 RepID=UPI003757C364
MSRRPGIRQRGVAVVTALLLTTLAVAIVASLFWQQQVQVRSMENQRLHFQTRWILRGGLDLVRLVLRQDLVDSHGSTRADGIWATPLAETRLDQFVERERIQNESFDATIAGQTYDAQSRYNLANLALNRYVLPGQVTVFQRLLQNLQLNPSLAQTVAEQVARSQVGSTTAPAGSLPGQLPVPGGNGQPMELVRVEDLLSISGFNQAAIEKLRDFVIVLPEGSQVNVNTAPAEVLSALTDLSVSEAQSLVGSRKRSFYGRVDEFDNYLKASGKKRIQNVEVAVLSNYFLVLSRVRLDRAELVSWALVKREPTGKTSIVWIREI